MELLKTRLQLQESSALTSPIECARRIFQTEGLKGLFRGQMITVMRDVSERNRCSGSFVGEVFGFMRSFVLCEFLLGICGYNYL